MQLPRIFSDRLSLFIYLRVLLNSCHYDKAAQRGVESEIVLLSASFIAVQ